ncbi:hypothetical protein [Klebsiella michiganensis]|uniref:hypothetical protein n=1 Tax=Klebsiella michiganensis TaxID=1134687 RepID=UPI003F4FCA8F
MKKIGFIVVLTLVASFSVSAKIVSGPDLDRQAKVICGMPDIAKGEKASLEAPTLAKTYSLNLGVLMAAIDALKANPNIPATDFEGCEKATKSQYQLGNDKYRRL